jgi:hypothetical protein
MESPAGTDVQVLVQASFDALDSLHRLILKLVEEGNPCPRIHPIGASLKASVQVLTLAEGSYQRFFLKILCDLPISLSIDLERQIVDTFILLSLRCCEKQTTVGDTFSEKEHDLVKLVFERIILLMKYCNDTVSTAERSFDMIDVLNKVFALRCSLDFSGKKTQMLWLECMRLILDKNEFVRDDGDNELLMDVLSEGLHLTIGET